MRQAILTAAVLLAAAVTAWAGQQGAGIVSFQARPEVVESGGPSTLTWEVSGAVAITLTDAAGKDMLLPDYEGDPGDAIPTTVEVRPETTTEYTLTARGTAVEDLAVRRVTVTVTRAAVVSFQARPEVVESGGPSTLTWEVSGAVAITLTDAAGKDMLLPDYEGDPGDAIPTTVEVRPETTTEYTLTARGTAVEDLAVRRVTVTVTRAAVVSFQARPEVVESGGPSTLTWEVSGARTITLTDAAGNNMLLAVYDPGDDQIPKSVVVKPETTTEYTLTARGTTVENQAVRRVTVTVTEATLPDGDDPDDPDPGNETDPDSPEPDSPSDDDGDSEDPAGDSEDPAPSDDDGDSEDPAGDSEDPAPSDDDPTRTPALPAAFAWALGLALSAMGARRLRR